MGFSDRSIEELENDFWGEPAFSSYVVKACHNARKKPLSQLSAEEIRLLAGQRIGLRFILPLAVDIIENGPLTEVTFYEGDMLRQLLRLDLSDWSDKAEFERFRKIVRDNYEDIMRCGEISREDIERILNEPEGEEHSLNLGGNK